jgi:hypothetical protein
MLPLLGTIPLHGPADKSKWLLPRLDEKRPTQGTKGKLRMNLELSVPKIECSRFCIAVSLRNYEAEVRFVCAMLYPRRSKSLDQRYKSHDAHAGHSLIDQ